MADSNTTLIDDLQCRLCDALMHLTVFGWGVLVGVCIHG